VTAATQGTAGAVGGEEDDKLTTGLRFTDILFGFVLRELVVRMVDWRVQPSWVRGHLILTAMVVLGSYVGYRNSRKRADYRVRFVNLPLLRFVLDQAMVFAYFRLAIATQDLDLAKDRASSVAWTSAAHLARIETEVLAVIAGCYLAWDLLGHVMASRREAEGQRRYPEISGRWERTLMTLAFLAVALLGVAWSHLATLGPHQVLVLQGAGFVSVLLYRTAKDQRHCPAPQS
jgi:hypothetical protein